MLRPISIVTTSTYTTDNSDVTTANSLDTLINDFQISKWDGMVLITIKTIIVLIVIVIIIVTVIIIRRVS